jgi:hypothetical protein
VSARVRVCAGVRMRNDGGCGVCACAADAGGSAMTVARR